MVQLTNKAVVFLNHPAEYPVEGEHFEVQTLSVEDILNENDVLLRNLYLSLDPFMRGLMREAKVPGAPVYAIGQVMRGDGISEVIRSRNPSYPVGTLVKSFIGWEEYTHVPSGYGLQILPEDARQQTKIPLSAYVGVLGMPGMTAHISLLKLVGEPKAGETIYISAASGAVGQLVGQIAKLYGLRVVGSAGSDEKVAYLLNDLQFDAAFNYKTPGTTILQSLREHAPEGIDIYYENVGGETLEAALECMKLNGRVIVSGMISQYNTATPYGIRNLDNMIKKRLTMRGFVINDLAQEYGAEFERDVTEWLLQDRIRYREDIALGISSAPQAFVGMLKGKNNGKQVVKIADL
ncbi:hypothetical protein B0O80DRAFT_435592 [Mortierella sp. GBAus27b]|nr:hypothetical protein BGX31_007249 [Mortierella sp. GBA43]KAI8362323.1 hypothetical protein B0O80DRAFT_435592 [Mortierella sp. GBAus27b]